MVASCLREDGGLPTADFSRLAAIGKVADSNKIRLKASKAENSLGSLTEFVEFRSRTRIGSVLGVFRGRKWNSRHFHLGVTGRMAGRPADSDCETASLGLAGDRRAKRRTTKPCARQPGRQAGTPATSSSASSREPVSQLAHGSLEA